MRSPRFSVIGHRGARGLFPENSLPAFEEALRLGVDEIELDVVISADSQVVVSHEAWMNPQICSGPQGQSLDGTSREIANLYKMDYADIRRYDCGRLGHPDFPFQQKMPVHKPLLSDTFAFTAAYTTENGLSPARFLIEIKCGEYPDGEFNPPPVQMAEMVWQVIIAGHQETHCRLQSFDHRVLNALKRLAPEIPLALLVEDNHNLTFHLSHLDFLPETFSPDSRLVTSQLLTECRNHGMKLIPWTVNEIEEMKHLIQLGVDGLITDYPDRLLKLRSTYPLI